MNREYVDLGLSVKWATMNIGAERITDHGSYFAWGETGNKDDYTWDAYQHGTSADDLTKYNYEDNKLALETTDDAAFVNWGKEWHIPTEIFLPAAGYYRAHAIEGAGASGYCWSSSRNVPFADRAICLYFVPNFIGIGNNGFRNGGFTIRPVI